MNDQIKNIVNEFICYDKITNMKLKFFPNTNFSEEIKKLLGEEFIYSKLNINDLEYVIEKINTLRCPYKIDLYGDGWLSQHDNRNILVTFIGNEVQYNIFADIYNTELLCNVYPELNENLEYAKILSII